MYKKIIKFLNKFFLSKNFFYLSNKIFEPNFTNTNFQNIIFDNIDELKKIYLSKKPFRKSIKNDTDFHSHSFNFINSGRVLGGEKNINLCKKFIFDWNKENYSLFSEIWSKKIATKRFINLIYNYDFYAISASDGEIKIINKILLKHYFFILHNISYNNIGDLSIEDIKAYILGLFIFRNEKKYYQKYLLSFIDKQLDINGFHLSYNPLKQAVFINNLNEIKNILLFFTKESPQKINFHILNMTSVLTTLFHKDDSLALFNGSNNFKIGKINKIIKISNDVKSKQINNIKNGIAVHTSKNKKIFMDIVMPSSTQIYKNFHAGTLSFEFSYLDEKIITNCGSIDTQLNLKSQYLKFSAAHSTIVLNNTNITNLNDNKLNKRIPKNITYEKKEDDNSISWTASHDGYINNFNKIVKREITIYKKIDKIAGKDLILNTRSRSKSDIYTIRFHLMPHTNCVISNNKKTVFIKTKKNQSWVFKSENRASIEDSIFINDKNIIEQSKQIVINGVIKDKNIVEKWVLFKS